MTYKLYRYPGSSQDDSVMLNKGNGNFISIPFDSANADYQEYLKWVAKGNTAEAADTIPAWDQVRTKRDNLLVSSDWTMITGATVDQAQWAAYRDKLRAIPQTFKNVSDPLTEITWPTAPSTKGPNTA